MKYFIKRDAELDPFYLLSALKKVLLNYRGDSSLMETGSRLFICEWFPTIFYFNTFKLREQSK